jgi:5-methyltetrahydrofolate--homocysteine methyltransferase
VAGIYESMGLEDSVINSVTLEDDRFDALLPIITNYNTGIVAMPIDSDGMPTDAQTRVDKASRLVDRLLENGIAHSRIFVDIVVEAAGASWEAPYHAIRATRMLREKYPDIHLLAGLSNVSFGLPGRAVINRTFLCSALSNGLDSAIMDSTNTELVLSAKAADIISGGDEYCMNYITAFRKLNEAK